MRLDRLIVGLYEGGSKRGLRAKVNP